MKNVSLSFCSILYDIFNLYTCKKRNEKLVLRLCNFLIKTFSEKIKIMKNVPVVQAIFTGKNQWTQ
jgi:hypothetical protein